MTGTFKVFLRKQAGNERYTNNSQNQKYESKFNHLFSIPTLQYIRQNLSKRLLNYISFQNKKKLFGLDLPARVYYKLRTKSAKK